MARKIYPYSLDRKDAKIAGVCSTLGARFGLRDELHDAARRLDDRLCSIERIMTAENPNWRQQCVPDRTESRRLLSDGE